MSYAQKKQLSGNPAVSIFLTIVVVGTLMYAIITGLAYNVIKHAAENLKTFDVQEAPPPPAIVTKAQSARGNLQGLFSGDDYPQDALRNEETGRVTVRLTIGTSGRVDNCSVISSSGSRSLDSATCRILTSRARFTPAKLSNGQPTTDTYTQTIVWQLQ